MSWPLDNVSSLQAMIEREDTLEQKEKKVWKKSQKKKS